MIRDYRERLDDATAAASDGASLEEIIEETGLDRESACRVIAIDAERRKRREARNGTL